MELENAEATPEPQQPLLTPSPTEFFYGTLDEDDRRKKEKARVTVTLQDAWTSKIREVVEGGARTSTSKAPPDEDEQDRHESWMFKLAQEADLRNAKELRQKGAQRKTPGLLRVRGRRRNSVKYDIFAEFGKDHEGLVEIEVGGVIRQRANFRRYWHSEPELKRWKQGLLDNARHDKISDGNRRIANREHFNSEMADLTQKHNGLFRQREPAYVPRNRAAPFRHLKELQGALMIGTSKAKGPSEKAKRNTMQAFLQSDFLRGSGWAEQRIQRILTHPDGAEKGSTRESIQTGPEPGHAPPTADEGPGVLGEFDPEHLTEQEAGIHSFFEFLRRRCPTGPNGTLDDVFNAFDTKKKGVISFSDMNAGLVKLGYDGDIIHVWRLLDANSSGSVAIKDLQKLKPYIKQYEVFKTKERKMLARKSMTAPVAIMTDPKSPSSSQDSSDSGLDAEDQDEESNGETRKSQTPGGRQHRFFLEQARKCRPQTLVIVVFKNCDRAHPGVPVFAARSPTTLTQLLSIASQACPPVVGPAEAMYDLNFNLVRKLDDVINGGSYLLKGAEVTLDPPASFFTQLPGCLPSLKEVDAVSRFAASEREFDPSPTRGSQADLSRASTAQGPSRPSSKGADSFSMYEPSTRPSSRALGSYWEVDGVIARKMGLGSTKHRNWDINPVLGSRPGTSSDAGHASHFEDF
mmetsp:Transcript_32044/g.73172  ORF Transcript_32044/g.73172 Transcript_32044/m.73172 type:complete len:689 (+) Transcript_32044:107-2173(+)